MDQIGVFAKFWEPGKVKTRLAKDLGGEAAAALYLQFLKSTLASIDQISQLRHNTRRLLAYDPVERYSEFRAEVAADWSLQPQVGETLGDRIRHYFVSAGQAGTERNVLIGSDTPNLPPAYLCEGLEALGDHTAVLGPTTDGGYYLVGLRDPTIDLFANISWSTPDVWSQTIERLRAAGCRWHCLPTWYDVDSLADLRRLSTDPATDMYMSEQVAQVLAAVPLDHYWRTDSQ